MKNKSWFTVKQLNKNVFALAEFNHWEKVVSYLIVDEDRAFLIDTGMGYESILNIVENITDKKTTVLLTHAHWDHIGSAHEFSSVWIYDDLFEIKSLKNGFNSKNIEELKQEYFKNDFKSRNYVIPRYSKIKKFSEKNQFKTKNFTIKIIHTPGHTPGSVCFFIPQKGWLFTGDTIYNGPLYAQLHKSNIDDFKNSINTLKHLQKKIKIIFPGHNSLMENNLLIDDAINAFDLKNTDENKVSIISAPNNPTEDG